jgi:hypothetical protein
MMNIKPQDRGTIHVADITIAQLSRGLYRSYSHGVQGIKSAMPTMPMPSG